MQHFSVKFQHTWAKLYEQENYTTVLRVPQGKQKAEAIDIHLRRDHAASLHVPCKILHLAWKKPCNVIIMLCRYVRVQ